MDNVFVIKAKETDGKFQLTIETNGELIEVLAFANAEARAEAIEYLNAMVLERRQ